MSINKTVKSKVSKGNLNINTDKLKIVGLIFIGLAFLGSIAFTATLFFNNKEGNDKIVVDDVDSETIEEMTNQIVYQAGAKEVEYYSPKIDSLIKYSRDDWYVSESWNGLNITPSSSDTVFAVLSLIDEKSSKALDNYLSKYKQYNETYEVIEERDLSDGKKMIALKWTQENPLSKDKMDIYHYVIEYKIDEDILILDITSRGKDEVGRYMDKYINVLNTVNLHPQGINEMALTRVPDLGIEFKFDRLKWSISSQTEGSISLSFLSNEYEKEKEFKWITTNIFISGFSIFKDEDPNEAIKKMKADNINGNYDLKDKSKFEMINEEGKKEIGGNQFIYYQYVYKDYGGVEVLKTKYYGFNPDLERIVHIATSHPNAESSGKESVSEIIKSINFREKKTTSKNISSSTDSEMSNIKVIENFIEPRKTVNAAETDTLEFDKAALLGKSAVVRIFNRSCSDVNFTQSSGFTTVSNKTYQICGAGIGSGFYVNNDGGVVTNSHVATPNLLDLVITGVFTGYDPDGLYMDLFYDTVSALLKVEPELFEGVDYSSPEFKTLMEDYMIAVLVDGYQTGYVKLSEPIYENYIQGDSELIFDEFNYNITNKDDHIAAQVVDYEDTYSVFETALDTTNTKQGVERPDLAILEVEGIKTNTALELADSEFVSVGQEIFVFGFPGSADNRTLFSSTSSNIPTITKGAVSAIKPNVTNAFDLIQIDAPISQGNSGGPITNSSGDVVGISTYAIAQEQSADFNAGVSVSEVNKMLVDNGLTNEVGTATLAIENGLDDFRKDYYQWAKEDFEKAISLNHSTSSVLRPLIKVSERKIQEGKDNTPLFVLADYNIHKNEAIIGGAVLLLFSLSILILLIVLITKKRKKRKNNVPRASQPKQNSNTEVSIGTEQQTHVNPASNVKNTNLNTENVNRPVQPNVNQNNLQYNNNQPNNLQGNTQNPNLNVNQNRKNYQASDQSDTQTQHPKVRNTDNNVNPNNSSSVR